MNKKLTLLAMGITAAAIAGCGTEEKKETTTEKSADVTVQDTQVQKNNAVEVEKTVKTDNEVKTEKAVVKTESDFIPVEGTHYEVIDSNLDVDQFDGVTISEFFWLGCSHCQRFEPAVQAWKEQIKETGTDARILKVAVPGGQRWDFDSAVYFTMKEMGATEEQTSAMLRLYEQHAAETRTLPSVANVYDFFEKLGLDKSEAKAILEDANRLNPILNKANQEYAKINANGVPQFVINGKYKIKFDGMKKESDIINTMTYINENLK